MTDDCSQFFQAVSDGTRQRIMGGVQDAIDGNEPPFTLAMVLHACLGRGVQFTVTAKNPEKAQALKKMLEAQKVLCGDSNCC